MPKSKEVKFKTKFEFENFNTRVHIAYRTFMPKFISNKGRNIKFKHKLPLNLRFKIEVKVFCFKLNLLTKVIEFEI
jgi:hypothetical protein